MPDSSPTSERLEALKARWESDKGARVSLQLADEYRRLGRREDAVAVLDEGLATNEGHVGARVARGRCLVELGRSGEAADDLEQVIEADPTQMVAYRLLVDAYIREGDADKARQRLRVYGLLNDSDPEIEELDRRIAELERAERTGGLSPPTETEPEPRSGSEAAEDGLEDLPLSVDLPDLDDLGDLDEVAAGEEDAPFAEPLSTPAPEPPSPPALEDDSSRPPHESPFPPEPPPSPPPAEASRGAAAEPDEEPPDRPLDVPEGFEPSEAPTTAAPEPFPGLATTEDRRPPPAAWDRELFGPEPEPALERPEPESAARAAEPPPAPESPDDPFDLDAPAAETVAPDLGELREEAPTPQEGRPTVTLGRLYLRQGHRDEAATIFRAVLERDPGNEDARRGLEEALARAVDAPSSEGPQAEQEAEIEPYAEPEPETGAAESPGPPAEPAEPQLDVSKLLEGYDPAVHGEGLTARKRYALERYRERIRERAPHVH